MTSTATRWENALVSPALLQISIIALAAMAVGGIAYGMLVPLFGGERNVNKRLANVSQGSARRRAQTEVKPLQMRRKQVQETVKDLEAKQQAKKKINLRTRLSRAGLTMTPRTFYLLSVAAGFVGAILALVIGVPLWAAGLAGFASAFGLPRWVLKRAAMRRQDKFLREFANAIDIIVRGIKTGLPLADCLQIIAREAPEPVRSCFIDLVEQQRVGIPLRQGFERMYDRMPLQEVNFFSIVVAVQAQTGGNLSEALANLSGVLRDRYRLQAKVKTYSAEAKASAMIIGSLPFVVMLGLTVASPDYIALLWTEPAGNIMLAGCGIWMFMGVLVMRKMINFDF